MAVQAEQPKPIENQYEIPQGNLDRCSVRARAHHQ